MDTMNDIYQDEKKEAVKREADTYAVVCLVLSILAFPLMCTFFGGAILLIISVVLGIVALKDRTSRAYLVIIGFVLDIVFLCVIGAFIYLIDNFGSVTVKDVSASPSGAYQVDVIANDDGALGGYYILAFERANRGKFASVGDKKPRDALYIDGSGDKWDTAYDITWASDNTFYALSHSGPIYQMNLLKVEIYPDSYQTFEGDVSIKHDESYFDHYEISGDKVFYVCYLNISNSFYETVEFSLEADDSRGQNGLLLDGHMIAVDPDGNEAVYSIDPGETEMMEVVFCGDKGTEDERTEDDHLPSVSFIPVSYNPGYEP